MLQLFMIAGEEGLTGREEYLFIHLHQNALQPFTPELPLFAQELCYQLSINLAVMHFICICPRGLYNIF